MSIFLKYIFEKILAHSAWVGVGVFVSIVTLVFNFYQKKETIQINIERIIYEKNSKKHVEKQNKIPLNNINFNKILTYKIYENGFFKGDALLKFTKKGTRRTGFKTHTLRLSGLELFGNSNDSIYITDMSKESFSIYSLILAQKGYKSPFFESRVTPPNSTELPGVMNIYKYRKYRDKNVNKKLFNYDYDIIDFLTGFLYSSEIVKTKEKNINVYFLIMENILKVSIEILPKKELFIGNKSVEAIAVSFKYLSDNGTYQEFLKYYIDKERGYPIQIVISLNNGEKTILKLM